MADRNLIFTDSKVREEFLDRFDDLVGIVGTDAGGLEGFDVMPFSKDDVQGAMKGMQEGSSDNVDPGLEAIILRFGRPAYFVKNDTFDTKGQPSSSAEVDGVVNGAKAFIDATIPSVGRINLRNHRKPWVGTGWVVAPNVLVTNRHGRVRVRAA